MDSIFGVPAHPFFVHIPVVLIPLAAVGVVVMTIRTSWWERYKWATLTVAGIGAVGAISAAGTGEELEEAVEVSRTESILFFAALLAGVVVLPWLMRRRNAGSAVGAPHVVTSPQWLRNVVTTNGEFAGRYRRVVGLAVVLVGV